MLSMSQNWRARVDRRRSPVVVAQHWESDFAQAPRFISCASRSHLTIPLAPVSYMTLDHRVRALRDGTGVLCIVQGVPHTWQWRRIIGTQLCLTQLSLTVFRKI